MQRSKILTLIVLAALLLSACSSAATPTIRPATQGQPTPTERSATSIPTKTTAPTSTEPRPEATATRKTEDATATQKAPSVTDTPAPTVFSFLEVGPDEWVNGPVNAPVTIIEYGDFQ